MDIETVDFYFPSLAEPEESLLLRIQNAKSNAKRVELCVGLLQTYRQYFLACPSKKVVKDNEAALKHAEKGRNLRVAGDFRAALEEYNRSLCLMDPSEAEEVMKEVYWGRALIYSELKLRDQCLENLRRLEILGVFPSTKINAVREKCGTSTVADLHRASEPNLRYQTHKNIPFIIEDISLEYSDAFGYHLVTNRNLKPGDIIMREKPYSAVVLPRDQHRKCATCLNGNFLNLVPCVGCKRAMFCSNACLLEGQRLFHRYECPIMDDLEKLLTPELTVALRNCLRGFCVYWSLEELAEVLHTKRKRERDFLLDFTSQNEKDCFRVVVSQTTNEALRPPSDLYQLSLAAAVMYLLLVMKTDLIERLTTPQHHDLLMELLLRFTQIATVNSFAVSGLPEIACRDSPDEVETEFAIATYPLLSFLNHSCVGNIQKTNVGDHSETMLVFATRPIKAGSQIFDTYFSGAHHYNSRRSDRQQILREQYNFTCFCEACSLNFPTHHELPVKVPNINLMHVISENFELQKFLSKEVIWRSFQKYCQALRSLDSLYPSKEIFVFSKCMLRCIWLLYKRPQVLYIRQRGRALV